MEKKNIRKAIMTTALIGGLAFATLGCSCNYDMVDFKYNFNKAFNELNRLFEIKKWTDYDGEQLQIVTKDGAIIITSSFDTKLINDINSTVKADDIARSILGEDAEINYLGQGKQLTLTP